MYLYDDTKRKKELYSPVVATPQNAWQRRADEIHNSLASGENQRLQTPQVVKYPNYDVSVKAPIDKPAKEDDFLAGFNEAENEEKEELQRRAERLCPNPSKCRQTHMGER